jgi:hypothetical protein
MQCKQGRAQFCRAINQTLYLRHIAAPQLVGIQGIALFRAMCQERDAIGCCYGLKLFQLTAVKSMGINQAYFGKRKSGPGYLFGIVCVMGSSPDFHACLPRLYPTDCMPMQIMPQHIGRRKGFLKCMQNTQASYL